VAIGWIIVEKEFCGLTFAARGVLQGA